jgi:hypothetical protein
MMRIPVLPGAPVGESTECPAGWGADIHDPGGLPDREHADFVAGAPFENRLDCGDPAQACRSGRGLQNDDADVIGVAVERVAQGRDRCRVERDERRLSLGDVRSAKVPGAERDCDEDRRGNRAAFRERTHRLILPGRGDEREAGTTVYLR